MYDQNVCVYFGQGNIRVFCRVRPLLGDECLGNDGIISHMEFPDQDQKILEVQKVSGDVTLNEVRRDVSSVFGYCKCGHFRVGCKFHGFYALA